MMVAVYLAFLEHAERALAQSFRVVAIGHGDEPDVLHLCQTLADQCDHHEAALGPAISRYGQQPVDEPERFHADGLTAPRTGPVGLLRDLQDLYVLASLVDTTWTMIKQAAYGLRDTALVDTVTRCEAETGIQLAWLLTRMKQAAPQALILAAR